MRYISLVLAFLTVPAVFAGEVPKHSCDDPEVNQQWRQALARYPQDPLLIKLSAMRTGLCNMIKNGQVDPDTARSIWEKALTTNLLERAKEEQEQRGLFRLFATF